MPPLTDEDLVTRFRNEQGSKASSTFINQLFERYHTKVAAWCYRTSGDRESASDLAQEVFMKAYRHLDSFQGNAKFSTWLYVIARNHCLNYLKSRAVEPSENHAELDWKLSDPGHSDPGEQIDREASLAALRELMTANLDPLEIQVMTLHYGEELPLQAITRLLDLPNLSGAKAYIVSARRKLNSAMVRWKARQSRPTPAAQFEGRHDHE